MEIKPFLETMVSHNASDIYLTVGTSPMYRIEGVTQSLGGEVFTPSAMEILARSIMNDQQWQKFDEQWEIILALSYSEFSRFRVNVFRRRGSVGIVVRKINFDIATLDDLGLCPVLKDIMLAKRGLILVVGATGSGKSTSLAAMIDHRNSNTSGHIITIEDPVEFVHRHKKSIVNQREVGSDTHSFQAALKSAMRQAPDVIFIGEIRDRETMEAAITFADTGHLCLATLHSTNANQAFERIINFFPEPQHAQIFLQLSLNLRAIISQRLVLGIDSRRVAALEILLDTLKEAMVQADLEGCQTFDMALFDLYSSGSIDLEQALSNADSVNNLRLKIKVNETQETGAEGVKPPPGLRLEAARVARRFERL